MKKVVTTSKAKFHKPDQIITVVEWIADKMIADGSATEYDPETHKDPVSEPDTNTDKKAKTLTKNK